MTIRSPTADEFLERARREFQFLEAEFGFLEQGPPARLDGNAFQLSYVNATTLVTVEGINWGFGVNVLLDQRRQPLFRRKASLPLWVLVKLRGPELHDTLMRGDQLDQLASHAAALKHCASDVLRGDFSVRSQVEPLLSQQRSAETSPLKEWRYRKVVEQATEAFRSKQYRTVVDLLLPFEAQLSPAQRSKLEYAKRSSTSGQSSTAAPGTSPPSSE